MKKPCAASLVIARELVEHGVLGEGAEVLVDLRRCAAERGCDDWQNCDGTIQGVWHEATHKRLPEARPRPRASRPGLKARRPVASVSCSR